MMHEFLYDLMFECVGAKSLGLTTYPRKAAEISAVFARIPNGCRQIISR